MNRSEFIIEEKSPDVYIYVDVNSNDLIQWATKDFAEDIGQITGKDIKVKFTDKFYPNTKGIYIGKFDDKLIKSLPENFTDQMQKKWESFLIKKHQDDLFIVGSDIRGTVYGIFEVAERIGISPWKWWADVTPQKKGFIELDLPVTGIAESPSVQFRGIFLNDEDWGLQPWAAHTFEPEIKDIGPKTYEKIFQLLLRLKANTIWPAMHPCTKAFFSISGNKEMAEKYYIYIGTSHAEPMLRNNVDEWNEDVDGPFNYFTNSKRIREYWQERISEAKNGNLIITMGMRGVHDSGMEGNVSQEEKVQMLEKVIKDQRVILKNTLHKSIEHIPQVFIPYKEVLDLYNAGLKVPDDITLMWTDDNYGYIRRLGNEAEQKRSGGSGVYYHLSYWGRPHDYLWLSSTQPGLIWYEITRAYQNGARKIWIANVGDIKPAEYNMEFFLDLAWDIDSISETTIKTHLINWSKREFGQEKGREIADVLHEYYRLAFLRKPEFMGWSRTEPITPTKMTEFTISNNNELQHRIDSYKALFNNVEKIKPYIPEERQDAFFQLVEYPVKGAALMNYKFLYAQQAVLSNDKNQKEILSEKSLQAYNYIKKLTVKYNNEINGGKWQNIMSMHPRDLPAYAMPKYHLSDSFQNKTKPMDQKQYLKPVFIQAADYTKSVNAGNFVWKVIEGLGYSDSSVTLFPFDNHMFENESPYLEYHFDVEKTGRYEIEIRCLPTHSNNFDQKLWIEIDGKILKVSSLNTKGRSEAWKKNVLRNFVKVTYPVTFEKTGSHILKVYVNQTGIVVDQLAINPDGYGKYYEITK
ncbi:MAG: glycosyl hydrolase 115 family protein [Calditrichaceae bacterium]